MSATSSGQRIRHVLSSRRGILAGVGAVLVIALVIRMVATFGAMDLAGAERPSSNGHEFAGVMEAVMSYWRDPASVRPCAAFPGLTLLVVTSTVDNRGLPSDYGCV